MCFIGINLSSSLCDEPLRCLLLLLFLNCMNLLLVEKESKKLMNFLLVEKERGN